MMVSLATHLVDFSAPPAVQTLRSPAMDGIAIESVREEAFRAGVEAGRAEAEQAFELRLCEIGDRADQSLATQRQEWSEDSHNLATKFQAAIEDLEARLSREVANVLVHLVGATRRDHVAREFAARLTTLLREDGLTRVRLSGPAALLDAIATHLPSTRVVIDRRPDDGIDAVARIDDTLLRTRLGEWQALLRATVEET